jgi:hypothetical protein
MVLRVAHLTDVNACPSTRDEDQDHAPNPLSMIPRAHGPSTGPGALRSGFVGAAAVICCHEFELAWRSRVPLANVFCN